MKATEYYCNDDTEMAAVIIASQEALYNVVMNVLSSFGYPTDEVTVEDAINELCRVTLA